MNDTIINLGDRVKDRITGFEGVVTGVVHYITGCNQVLVAPKAVDNAFKPGEWFDIDRCEVIEAHAVNLENVSSIERPGADRPAPRR